MVRILCVHSYISNLLSIARVLSTMEHITDVTVVRKEHGPRFQ
jgi:hypothetical protein